MTKMKTKYIKIKGIFAWAQVQPNNYDDFRGSKNWKITVYPSKEEIEKLKEAGSQTRMKYDEGDSSGVEGKCFQFKRQVERDWGRGVEKLEPPKITYQGEPYDGLIGNGSVGTVELEIYATKNFGNGTRLVSVDITDLIEYNKDSEEDEQKEDTGKIPVEDINIGTPEPKKKGRAVDW